MLFSLIMDSIDDTRRLPYGLCSCIVCAIFYERPERMAQASPSDVLKGTSGHQGKEIDLGSNFRLSCKSIAHLLY